MGNNIYNQYINICQHIINDINNNMDETFNINDIKNIDIECDYLYILFDNGDGYIYYNENDIYFDCNENE